MEEEKVEVLHFKVEDIHSAKVIPKVEDDEVVEEIYYRDDRFPEKFVTLFVDDLTKKGLVCKYCGEEFDKPHEICPKCKNIPTEKNLTDEDEFIELIQFYYDKDYDVYLNDIKLP